MCESCDVATYVLQGEWKEAAVSALWDAISDCLCEIEVRVCETTHVVSVLTALGPRVLGRVPFTG